MPTLKDLHTEYRTAVEAARAILDAAETDKRSLTAEETAAWDKANADVDRLQGQITRTLDDEDRARKATELETRVAAALGAPAGHDGSDADEKRVRAFLTGESRRLDIAPRDAVDRLDQAQVRSLTKGTTTAGGHTVPTTFYGKLMEHMIEVSGVLAAGATVLTTDSGENIEVPKTTGHSTGALVTEGGTISASDPAFGQATLGAYKYGVLIQVAYELAEDTGVNLLDYLARQAGRAVGNAFGVHAITGDGSSKPSGIVTGSTQGVAGDAAVAGAFTADNLIDLYYSVISPYRNSPSCAWLMRDATVAKVRKLKDANDQYLWQPSLQIGSPETLLGKPVHTDPNVAAVAATAKSVLFGDIGAYFVRQANGIRFERSDDYAFNTDLITFRALVRMDGVLVDQTGAVKHFVGGAAS